MSLNKNDKLIENTSFIVFRDNSLTAEERKILTHLYMPIIGTQAINIYLTLETLIETNQNESMVIGHLKLLKLLQYTNEDIFIQERHKLEAVGLLKVFCDNQNYLYYLLPAMMPNDFFQNEILNNFLYQQLGESEYQQLYCEFLVHQFDISKYQDITVAFDEIYETSIPNEKVSYNEELNSLLIMPSGEQIKVKNPQFDYKYFHILMEALDILDVEILNSKMLYNLVNHYSFIYQLTSENIKDALVESVILNRQLDIEKFKLVCRNIYDKTAHPVKIIQKETTQPEKDKLINYLEQTSTTEIIKNMFGVGLVGSEISMFDQLMKDNDLNIGIINVLAIYVIKDKNGEVPSYNYFNKVIKTWRRMKITTTKEAIEYINGRSTTTTPKGKPTKNVPSWYNEYVKDHIETKPDDTTTPVKPTDDTTIKEIEDFFKVDKK